MATDFDSTWLFTSESVTAGHPDKVADQISDSILDAVLAEDPNGRVACETLVTRDLVVVAGEITTTAVVDYEAVVRQTVRDIGYTVDGIGFAADTAEVQIRIGQQSPDIARGVDISAGGGANTLDPDEATGAGDQGMMFGYACTETPQLMPLPITLAHGITRRLRDVREDGTIGYLRPDGKAQVTVRYSEEGPIGVEKVVVSTQHADRWNGSELDLATVIVPDIVEHVVRPALGRWWNDRVAILVNPTGRFEVGGPAGDTGLTGRKIIVDTYGGSARHGGGAFSGKDATKVDRSASYAARWVAKHVVAAGLADRCEVQVAYAIGVAKPVSIHLEVFGTEHGVPVAAIREAVEATFDLRPEAIIRTLDLRRPMYSPTAAFGHFGRTDLNVPWEQLERVDELRSAAETAAANAAPARSAATHATDKHSVASRRHAMSTHRGESASPEPAGCA